MATSSRTKPRVNVGTIGHVGHGKTTLTAAIAKVLAEEGRANAIVVDKIEKAPQEIAIAMRRVKYETGKRRYAHVDCRGHADYVKNMIAGASKLDGGILVVSALDGLTPQTRQQILLAHQVALPSLVCFLSKVDQVSNPESLDRVEMEIRGIV